MLVKALEQCLIHSKLSILAIATITTIVKEKIVPLEYQLYKYELNKDSEVINYEITEVIQITERKLIIVK